LSFVKLTPYHVTMIVWCGSDSGMCHSVTPSVIFSFSLILVSLFCLNLVLIFEKIEQFCPSPNWNQIYFLCKWYTNIFIKIDIFLLDIFNKIKFIQIYILHWTLFKISLKFLIENNTNRKKNQIIVLIFYYIIL